MNAQVAKLLTWNKATIAQGSRITALQNVPTTLCSANPLRLWLQFNVTSSSADYLITPDSILPIAGMPGHITNGVLDIQEFWVDRHAILCQTGWTFLCVGGLSEIVVTEVLYRG